MISKSDMHMSILEYWVMSNKHLVQIVGCISLKAIPFQFLIGSKFD